MTCAVYTQGAGFDIEEVRVPDAGAGEILIRVEGTAICGTDIKIVRGGHKKLLPNQRIVLGHEFAGVIEKAGSGVKGLARGMRVGVAPNWGCRSCAPCRRGMANLCPDYSAFGINTDGSHASHVRVPAAVIEQGNVVLLPEDVCYEEMALAEPLSCVLNGQKAVRVSAGDNVLIYGAGPMGMLHVLAARAAGVAKTVVVDQDAGRLDKARKMGADMAINNSVDSVESELRRLGPGPLIDVAIIATPVRELASEALGLLAPFGRLCLFAGLRGDTTIVLDSNAIHYGNLCVTGTTGGATADYRDAVSLIAARKVDVRPVISHRFALKDLREAYRVAMAGEGLKMVLTP